MPSGRSGPLNIPGAQRGPSPSSADGRGSSLGPPPSLFYLPSRPNKAKQIEGQPGCAVASASTSTAGPDQYIPIPAQRHPRYASPTTTSYTNTHASKAHPGAHQYLPTGLPVLCIDTEGEESSTFFAAGSTPMAEHKYPTLEDIMQPAIASRSKGFDIDHLVDDYINAGQRVTEGCEKYVEEPHGMIEGSQKAIQQLKVIRRASSKDSDQRLSIDKQMAGLKEQIRAFEAVKKARHGQAGEAILHSMNIWVANNDKALLREEPPDWHLLNDPRYTGDSAPRWQSLLLPGVFEQEGRVSTDVRLKALSDHEKPSSFIPDWFLQLAQSYGIDIEKQNDIGKQFRALCQHINALELASGRRPGGEPYTENEQWDKIWHEPSPDWSTPVRRERGGWWRCRSGNDKATAAEKACSLCHGEKSTTEGENETETSNDTWPRSHSKEAAASQLDRIEAAIKAAMAIVAKKDQEVVAKRGGV